MPWWLWLAAPVAAVAAVAAFYATRDSNGGADAPLDPVSDASGVVHIHGLGVNPADGNLYAATHGGVFRITEDGEATRIANRHQDTMGFTIVGPDHFLASGHPDMREDLPPLLGLLESRDAGETWTKKSLLGEADFHALRYSHGSVYGYDSTGSALMVSADGRTWETRSKTMLRDFAVSPQDPETILATTPDGLQRSIDGGRTWTQAESPLQPVLLDWSEPDRLWLVDFAGQVHRSSDGGREWNAQGNTEQQPEAFHDSGDELYLATSEAILVSRDGGQTWDVFYTEGTHR